MNVAVYPINVVRNGRESCVILAILNNKASNAMLFPCAISFSADQRATAIAPAGVNQTLLSIARADEASLIETVAFGNNRHYCLLENVVCWAWVFDRAPSWYKEIRFASESADIVVYR